MPYQRRGDSPSFLEYWGTPILLLVFVGCLIGIYFLGRHFL